MVEAKDLLPQEVMGGFPESIDVNPTAQCNLACRFCWGPEHSIPDGLDTNQWKDALSFFSENGTNSVVFTGGEPLIRQDIGELVKFAHDLGMRVTLSTNTLLLPRKAESVLPYVHEIGIPIDGSDAANNGKMRIGNPRAFQASLNALELLSQSYPDVHVTVRTVVSKVNSDDIESIGGLLASKKDMFDRWKLYQFAPVSIGAGNQDEFNISTAHFMGIVGQVSEKFPDLPIASYPSENRVGRYVFIGPEGNIFGVDATEGYRTTGHVKDLRSTPSEKLFGGVYSDYRNKMHAHT